MADLEEIYRIESGEGPLIAAAIHDGHGIRNELTDLLAISAEDRLREEDPHTATWTTMAPTRVVGLRSRFEVDLNRPRDSAVYLKPEDAWGLKVWHGDLAKPVIEQSLAEYDDFYAAVEKLLAKIESKHGKFVVFDLHSYNHRRQGPDGPPADPDANPQVNLGLADWLRPQWSPLLDRFISDLSNFDFPTGPLDVRENVKFRGARFSRWVLGRFPGSACVLSLEFKKFFMDEWSGEVDPSLVEAIGHALTATVPGLLAELDRL